MKLYVRTVSSVTANEKYHLIQLTVIIVFFLSLSLFVEGKPIPTELRKDEAELRKLLAYDEKESESKKVVFKSCFLNDSNSL